MLQTRRLTQDTLVSRLHGLLQPLTRKGLYRLMLFGDHAFCLFGASFLN